MNGRIIPEASIYVPLQGKNLDSAAMASHPEISTVLQAAIVEFAKAIEHCQSEVAEDKSIASLNIRLC